MTSGDATEPSAAMRAALRAVYLQTAQAEAEFAAIQGRLTHLREAASGLQGLLGGTAAREIAQEVGVRVSGVNLPSKSGAVHQGRRMREARQATLVAETRKLQSESEGDGREEVEPEALRAVGEAEIRRAQARRNAAAHLDRAVHQEEGGVTDIDDATSTDKVVLLLREHEGQAIPRAMILDQFVKRGWVEESWKEPEAAIRMAIRRAVDRGEATQTNNGRLMFKPPSLFTGTDAEGGDA